jgi:alkylation response protein AidB-like acyl-CoA dehydrogenase
MRFTLTAEQRDFRDAVDSLLQDADSVKAARAWAAGDTEPGIAIWQRLDAMGLHELAIAEESGGLGFHPVELCVALERIGYHAAPGPYADSLAAGVSGESGSPDFTVAALLTSARLLGLGRAALDLAVGYAKQRVQFGRPIGEYQAVKHRLADALVGLEFARPLVFAAALAPGADHEVSAAKVAASEAAYRAARASLQVHGAIGYTDEYDLSVYFKQIRSLYAAWGTPATHRVRVLAALS